VKSFWTKLKVHEYEGEIEMRLPLLWSWLQKGKPRFAAAAQTAKDRKRLRSEWAQTPEEERPDKCPPRYLVSSASLLTTMSTQRDLAANWAAGVVKRVLVFLGDKPDKWHEEGPARWFLRTSSRFFSPVPRLPPPTPLAAAELDGGQGRGS
jgi:hypothetical protein